MRALVGARGRSARYNAVSAIAAMAVGLGLAATPVHPVQAAQRRLTLDLTGLSDASVTERLDFLVQRLDAEQTGAALWQYGWSAFNGGTLIADAVEAATDDDRKDRNTHIVRAVEGFYGILDLWLRPLPARFGADPVRALPRATAADRRGRLARAEELVSRGADRAEAPYTLLPHLTVLGVNLVAGLAIWQLADLPHAYRTVLPGLLIGEAQIWTQPHGPAGDAADYRENFGGGSTAANWWLTPEPGGVEVTIRF